MNHYPELGSRSASALPTKVDLSIVVPLHNEELCVDPLLDAIDRVYAQQDSDQVWEVVLVDDGSSDATVAHALQASEQTRAKVTILQLQRNFGQTAAMQAGLDAASGDLIVTMDGDLQNDPADIPMMVRHLHEHDLDLLVGRREKRKDGLFLRLIPSWIANRLIAVVTGVNIRDNGCSLKVYRASVIKQVRLQGEMHRFIPAWVAAISPASRIGEVDVSHHAREFGESKYGLSRTIRVMVDLIAVRFFMKFHARPGHFFGTAGLAAGLAGVALALTAVASKFIVDLGLGFQVPLLLGAMLMMMAIQLIATGVIAEMVSRIYHDSDSHPTYLVGQVTTGGGAAAPDSPAAELKSKVIPIRRPTRVTTDVHAGGHAKPKRRAV
jgi:hypothetical protein